MRKWDVVVRKDGGFLHSGCERYCSATVLSLQPFVLVSYLGDMRWSATVKVEDFKPYRRASIRERWNAWLRRHK